ncbi:DUF2795 domain-containing protein [Catellatospora paridis]|uniref:DUF2795 domain-containing protein n=1 Tax=Catellatospora paridis TaxID=1617086 RepID=UPI0012D3E95E|nr:DUF2795 domain-containing protein [Catellatospora paridis]
MTHTPYGSRQAIDPVEDDLDARSWDTPGRDGVVGDDERDPDRRELRARIGQQVSLATFPATAEQLLEVARRGDAPDEVLDELGTLESGRTFENARELWQALGLEVEERF